MTTTNKVASTYRFKRTSLSTKKRQHEKKSNEMVVIDNFNNDNYNSLSISKCLLQRMKAYCFADQEQQLIELEKSERCIVFFIMRPKIKLFISFEQVNMRLRLIRSIKRISERCHYF